MNYLAHATLAEDSDAARLGSLLGDFSRGLELERFPEAVRFAVLEHRALDRHFDALEEVDACRALFPSELRRFSGILVDVFYDHWLAREWQGLMDVPIESVTASLYRALATFERDLPPRLANVGPRIVAQDWLGGYGEERNIARAIAGIEKRFRRSVHLTGGLDVLRQHAQTFRDLVRSTFPGLQLWVSERRVGLENPRDSENPRWR